MAIEIAASAARATAVDHEGLTVGVIIAIAGALRSASGGMDGVDPRHHHRLQRGGALVPGRRGLALLLTVGAIVFLVLVIGLVTVVPANVAVLGLAGLARFGGQVVSQLPRAARAGRAGCPVPRRPPREDALLRWVTPDAAVATIVWLIGSAGFSFYVGTFETYNQTYGALAGVIVVDLWLFLSAFAVLLGAESTPSPRPRPAATQPPGHPESMGRRGAVKADEPGSRCA